MSDNSHQAGKARGSSKKKKRQKNRPITVVGKVLASTAQPPDMTISQSPEKKKRRRSRKRKSAAPAEGPGGECGGSPGKKPKLGIDIAASPAGSSALCSVKNNMVGECVAETSSKLATSMEECANRAVVPVNCASNACAPPADEESAELRRIKIHLQKQRKALPIFAVRHELVRVVKQRDCVILIGETACGKTTQLPQYLHATGFTKRGIIGITQPRRVAAVTVADRVAMEMGVNLGDLVGYSVRFDDTTSNATRIKYLTDGMLLREALLDPLLQRYSVIVLDEAHERTINTDILFGIVKSAQEERRRLGKTPLKMMHAVKPQEGLRLRSTSHCVPDTSKPGTRLPITVVKQGDILVFCTGQEEIESVVRHARETRLQLEPDEQNILALPLYAALPSSLQLKVFEPTPKGWRKVIFSTNIAETSITIPGIKYVVDTGVVKERTYQPETGLEVLKVRKISKAQASQRAGRAGRECSGVCYRLYTKAQYEAMREHGVPEIQRCSLAGVVLQMLALGIKDVFAFDFMDKPSEKHLMEALIRLHQLGAVEKKEELQLTSLGQKMAAFPLEPRFAKIILCSKELGCTEEILTIISILSGDSVLYFAEKNRERANEVWKKFQSNEGDHVMLLNVYKAYKSAKGNKDSTAFRKCLAAGLFTNVAELQKNGDYLTLDARKKVYIHPSSCLFQSSPACVVFTEMVETTKCYMRNLTLVDPDWLPDIAPQYFKKKRLGAKALS
ncbi:hypothetical protein HPB48_019076 [Haemaphysalis longicornis]|uniref:RNA helicase n=1 Tax=Haemaphysalis longicornis TaxID=44386 RepID=A0A9J6G6U7_HAELO|nr:hypothetical protein HPB48_019076 [Haemaphysalis longicornis]